MREGRSGMSQRQLQDQIDGIHWYHEFDFGQGLYARSSTPDVVAHRRIWGLISRQLDRLDWRGRSVLDIGCWDGYWSFDAERRGAGSVLASDDVSQNWAAGAGLRLARKLLNSEVNQSLSIYELAGLGRKFDIILCLGVYYHLLDPFYALAQIRHCCHEQTIVVLEGDVARYGVRADTACLPFGDATAPLFVPSVRTLDKLLMATYFQVESQAFLNPAWRAWANSAWRKVSRTSGLPAVDRAVTICQPFRGANTLHDYRPPFGLHQYDDRFAVPLRAVA
jgi:tRNA (mo5U34)-methyltransferase